nr:hypothetical protein [Cressdnaviricota sp.]
MHKSNFCVNVFAQISFVEVVIWKCRKVLRSVYAVFVLQLTTTVTKMSQDSESSFQSAGMVSSNVKEAETMVSRISKDLPTQTMARHLPVGKSVSAFVPISASKESGRMAQGWQSPPLRTLQPTAEKKRPVNPALNQRSLDSYRNKASVPMSKMLQEPSCTKEQLPKKLRSDTLGQLLSCIEESNIFMESVKDLASGRPLSTGSMEPLERVKALGRIITFPERIGKLLRPSGGMDTMDSLLQLSTITGQISVNLQRCYDCWTDSIAQLSVKDLLAISDQKCSSSRPPSPPKRPGKAGAKRTFDSCLEGSIMSDISTRMDPSSGPIVMMEHLTAAQDLQDSFTSPSLKRTTTHRPTPMPNGQMVVDKRGRLMRKVEEEQDLLLKTMKETRKALKVHPACGVTIEVSSSSSESSSSEDEEEKKKSDSSSSSQEDSDFE